MHAPCTATWSTETDAPRRSNENLNSRKERANQASGVLPRLESARHRPAEYGVLVSTIVVAAPVHGCGRTARRETTCCEPAHPARPPCICDMQRGRCSIARKQRATRRMQSATDRRRATCNRRHATCNVVELPTQPTTCGMQQIARALRFQLSSAGAVGQVLRYVHLQHHARSRALPADALDRAGRGGRPIAPSVREYL